MNTTNKIKAQKRKFPDSGYQTTGSARRDVVVGDKSKNIKESSMLQRTMKLRSKKKKVTFNMGLNKEYEATTDYKTKKRAKTDTSGIAQAQAVNTSKSSNKAGKRKKVETDAEIPDSRRLTRKRK